ncbi:hypothetical protein [Spirosoma pomorum]
MKLIEDGSIILKAADGGFWQRQFSGPVYANWFQVTGRNDYQVLQKAIDSAATLKINVVVVPHKESGYNLENNTLIVRKGVELRSEKKGVFRRIVDTYQRINSTKTSGAVVILENHSTVSDFLFFHTNQKYSLSNSNEKFNPTAAVLQLGNSASNPYGLGIRINNVAAIGFLTIINQPESILGVDLLEIDGLYGMPLECGFNIFRSWDVCRVSNVHFNLNSYDGLLTGNTTNYFYKVASTATLFRGGQIDEWQLTNVFGFGFKHFLHSARNMFTGDKNGGGAYTLVNCSADGCHQPIRIERNTSPFDIKILGGFMWSFVKVGNTLPSVVSFSPQSFNVNVILSGVNIASIGTNGQSDFLFGSEKTKSADYLFNFEAGSHHCSVLVAGGVANEFNLSLANISLNQPDANGNFVDVAAVSANRQPLSGYISERTIKQPDATPINTLTGLATTRTNGTEFVGNQAYVAVLNIPVLSNAGLQLGWSYDGTNNLYCRTHSDTAPANVHNPWIRIDKPSLQGNAPPNQNADYIGQEFIDTVNRKVYKAVSLGTGADDWIVLN